MTIRGSIRSGSTLYYIVGLGAGFDPDSVVIHDYSVKSIFTGDHYSLLVRLYHSPCLKTIASDDVWKSVANTHCSLHCHITWLNNQQ